MSKRINSNKKGKSAELAVAHLLTDDGYPARRGQQYSGGGDSPDVVCESLPYNFEVKRVEALNLDKAMEQSRADAEKDGRIPLVIHRKNNKPWKVTMDYSDWIELVKRAYPNE